MFSAGTDHGGVVLSQLVAVPWITDWKMIITKYSLLETRLLISVPNQDYYVLYTAAANKRNWLVGRHHCSLFSTAAAAEHDAIVAFFSLPTICPLTSWMAYEPANN